MKPHFLASVTGSGVLLQTIITQKNFIKKLRPVDMVFNLIKNYKYC